MVIEAPAWALLSLGFVFTFAFLWVWDKTFRATLGPALRAVGNVGWGGVRGIGATHPLRFLVRTADAIEAWTAKGLQGSERGMVYSFTKAGVMFALLFGVPLAIALALYELAHYVVHRAPQIISRTVHQTIVRPIERTVRVTSAVSKAQFARLNARVRTLEHKLAHTAKATAGAIASPFPRIGRLERTVKAQTQRLTRLEKILAAGLGVAVVARALARLGLGWARCRNVGKVGRRLCGADTGWLDALLAGTLLIVGTISLREFAEEVGSITEEASGLIHGFLRDA